MRGIQTDISRRVALILEDEPFISLDIEYALWTIGIQHVRVAVSSEDAEIWLADHTPDLAVIDVVIRNKIEISVARILTTRRVPTLIYSGLPQDAIFQPPDFKGLHILEKPATPELLRDALTKLIDSR